MYQAQAQAQARAQAAAESEDPVVTELAAGRYAQAAAKLLQRAQESPDDLQVRSRLLLAFIGAGAMDRASDLLADLWEEGAALEGTVPEWEDLVDGPVELRRHVVRAVRYAHDVQTPEAWGIVSLLMQAEGRFQLAEKMAARSLAVRTESAPAGE